MNKLIKILSMIIIVASLSYSCDDEVPELEIPVVPSGLSVTVEVLDDAGTVTFTPAGTDVFFFEIRPGGGVESVQIQPGQTATVGYPGSGNLTFTASIIAFGTGGVSSTITQEVEVFIELRNDPELIRLLTGDVTSSTRRWIWDQNVGGINGHFGVGDPATDFPGFFAADANLLDPCLYDDVLEFSVDANGITSYNLMTQGMSFLNSGQIDLLFPGEGGNGDMCRPADDLLTLQTSFSALQDDGVNRLALGGGALSPLSYFQNVAEWQILELTDEILRVRGITVAGDLAWYHQFIREDVGGGREEGRIEEFDELVFADEFDVDGAPNPAIWSYDLGDGCSSLAGCGWGNGEAQYYTDRPENIIVENGVLKVTARRETLGTREFTSARINTQDKFEFTFGRIDFRAKLPASGGTWVATWMLGADIESNPWPGAGEIDVMEHVGNQENRIFGTTHTPAGFAGDGVGGELDLPDATSEFHIYSVDWTSSLVNFYIDDELYFSYSPDQVNESTFPFDSDFFLLINFAMGGTFGGNIDAAFTEEVFEIDYVRVYQ